jgi:T4-like virus Myoviridae tail sheath stabiliser
MDYFYDGQIRRYVTQFMRVFIGFKYKAGDEERQVPVMYGDMSRQVAAVIKENSENKMSTVPKIACYISGLEMDMTRMSDASFVSKVNVRERRYTDVNGAVEYQNVQGGNYTVERLMPTPFKMSMKADIWTSNTDQKLQLLEQILVLFNPSLEIQTTDNYLDWTSLSVIDLTTLNFSSRSIPAGAESEIDICTLEFSMPVWITPPAKVKKLGIVQTVISNVFTEAGDIINLEELVYNRATGGFGTTTNRYRILLFKSNTGNTTDNQYEVTLVNPDAAVLALGLDQRSIKLGEPVDWNAILEVQGGYKPGSTMYFKKPNGGEIIGTSFVVSPLDPTIIIVSLDVETFPGNDDIISAIESRGTVDAVIDPYKYNPVEIFGGQANIPVGQRFLMLDDINPNDANFDGPDGWKNLVGDDIVIKANSIIEWSGTSWTTVWDPDDNALEDASIVGEDFAPTHIQNIRTGIKYRWDGTQWLKAFEGEYAPGEWNFIIPS